MTAVRGLWLAAALASVAAGLMLGFGVATLYAAGWLTGFTPALGWVLLQLCQVALGMAGARSPGALHLLMAIASGVALLIGYSAVAVLLPSISSQWIFLVPALPLVLAVVSSLIFLTGRIRGTPPQADRSSQDR